MKPQPKSISIRSTLSASSRAVVLCLASILAGSAFGLLANTAMRTSAFAMVAISLGGIIGLLTSPFLVFALWHTKRRMLGALVTFLPTALSAFLAGLFTPPSNGPWLSAAISMSTYLITCLAFGTWTRMREIDERDGPNQNLCPSCGYSLEGLPADAVCPECGACPTDVPRSLGPEGKSVAPTFAMFGFGQTSRRTLARAKLDDLLKRGLVEPVMLLPAHLGGTDDARNVTWLPRACIAEMEAFATRVREFVKNGGSARYSAVPEYDSDDFVPDRLVLGADLGGQRVTTVLDVRSHKVW